MSKQEKSVELKQGGCNCAQAVLLALCDETGIPSALACRTACGFGGGMRCGELCGGFTGAVMAIGLALGNDAPEDTARRDNAYAAVIEFNRRMKERFGTLLCRELLGADSSTPEGKALLEREPERKGICDKAIAAAEQQARDIIAQYRAR